MARYSVRDEKGRFVKKSNTSGQQPRGTDGKFVKKSSEKSSETKVTVRKVKGVSDLLGLMIKKLEALAGCLEKLESNKEDK